MDWKSASSRIRFNFKRVVSTAFNDKRMRASAIAFILCSTSLALFQKFDVLFNTFVHLIGLFVVCNLVGGYRQYKYTCQAVILGTVCGTSISIGLNYGFANPPLQFFCLYSYVFAMFHFSEFFVTGLTNIDSLKPDSFLLNHSTAYWIAASSSWLEFVIEAFLFPNFYYPWLSFIGLAMTITGEILRKLGMCHASAGFTHQIAIRKQKNHVLVTKGVYGLFRHPGYLGWLLWSVGTQIILCNPICTCVYAYVTFNFFEDRIYEEEKYLIEFFGQRYIAYQQKVPTGIPGIPGFRQKTA